MRYKTKLNEMQYGPRAKKHHHVGLSDIWAAYGTWQVCYSHVHRCPFAIRIKLGLIQTEH